MFWLSAASTSISEHAASESSSPVGSVPVQLESVFSDRKLVAAVAQAGCAIAAAGANAKNITVPDKPDQPGDSLPPCHARPSPRWYPRSERCQSRARSREHPSPLRYQRGFVSTPRAMAGRIANPLQFGP